MENQSLNGCCVATQIYNLGGAHSIPRYKSLADFYKAMMNRTSQVTICFTNGNQAVERQYLEQIGFDHHNQGGIWVHSISNSKFQQFRKNPLFAEQAKIDEEKKADDARRLAERDAMRLAAMERERLLREQKDARRKAREENGVRKPNERRVGDLIYARGVVDRHGWRVLRDVVVIINIDDDDYQYRYPDGHTGHTRSIRPLYYPKNPQRYRDQHNLNLEPTASFELEFHVAAVLPELEPII